MSLFSRLGSESSPFTLTLTNLVLHCKDPQLKSSTSLYIEVVRGQHRTQSEPTLGHTSNTVYEWSKPLSFSITLYKKKAQYLSKKATLNVYTKGSGKKEYLVGCIDIECTDYCNKPNELQSVTWSLEKTTDRQTRLQCNVRATPTGNAEESHDEQPAVDVPVKKPLSAAEKIAALKAKSTAVSDSSDDDDSDDDTFMKKKPAAKTPAARTAAPAKKAAVVSDSSDDSDDSDSGDEHEPALPANGKAVRPAPAPAAKPTATAKAAKKPVVSDSSDDSDDSDLDSDDDATAKKVHFDAAAKPAASKSVAAPAAAKQAASQIDSSDEDDSDDEPVAPAKSPPASKVIVSFNDTLPNIYSTQLPFNVPLDVPVVFDTLLNTIEAQDGLQAEGLFRISPTLSDRDALQQQFIRGNFHVKSKDPHITAALLKHWLMTLSEPVLPYQPSIDVGKLAAGDDDDDDADSSALQRQLPNIRSKLYETYKSLSPLHHRVLHRLYTFLQRVSKSAATKMSTKALAVVFAPALIRSELSKKVTASVQFENAKCSVKAMELMLQNVDVLEAAMNGQPLNTGKPTVLPTTAKSAVSNKKTAALESDDSDDSSDDDIPPSRARGASTTATNVTAAGKLTAIKPAAANAKAAVASSDDEFDDSDDDKPAPTPAAKSAVAVPATKPKSPTAILDDDSSDESDDDIGPAIVNQTNKPQPAAVPTKPPASAISDSSEDDDSDDENVTPNTLAAARRPSLVQQRMQSMQQTAQPKQAPAVASKAILDESKSPSGNDAVTVRRAASTIVGAVQLPIAASATNIENDALLQKLQQQNTQLQSDVQRYKRFEQEYNELEREYEKLQLTARKPSPRNDEGEDVKQLQEELDAERQTIKQLQQQLQTHDTLAQELQQQTIALKQENSELKKENSELKKVKPSNKQAPLPLPPPPPPQPSPSVSRDLLKKRDEEIVELKQQLKRATTELSKSVEQCDELEDQTTILKQQLQAAREYSGQPSPSTRKSVATSAEVAKLTQQIEQLQTDNEELEAQLSAAKKQMKQLQQQAATSAKASKRQPQPVSEDGVYDGMTAGQASDNEAQLLQAKVNVTNLTQQNTQLSALNIALKQSVETLSAEIMTLKKRSLQFDDLQVKASELDANRYKGKKDQLALIEGYKQLQQRYVLVQAQLKDSEDIVLYSKQAWLTTNTILEHTVKELEIQLETLKKSYSEVLDGKSIDQKKYATALHLATTYENQITTLRSRMSELQSDIDKKRNDFATQVQKTVELENENEQLKQELVKSGIALQEMANNSFELREYIRLNVKK